MAKKMAGLALMAVLVLAAGCDDVARSTLNECINGAKEACQHGVGSVQHGANTGDCKFTCLAAPPPPSSNPSSG
jgi:hypothetical protein